MKVQIVPRVQSHPRIIQFSHNLCLLVCVTNICCFSASYFVYSEEGETSGDVRKLNGEEELPGKKRKKKEMLEDSHG